MNHKEFFDKFGKRAVEFAESYDTFTVEELYQAIKARLAEEDESWICMRCLTHNPAGYEECQECLEPCPSTADRENP
jgi:ribosomal protein L40E